MMYSKINKKITTVYFLIDYPVIFDFIAKVSIRNSDRDYLYLIYIYTLMYQYVFLKSDRYGLWEKDINKLIYDTVEAYISGNSLFFRISVRHN